MNTMINEGTPKIAAKHLERAAYVYVRQSSPRQVVEHLESQRRQYGRVDWAMAAGWPRERIVVVDEDQGKSGAAARTRPGFARLLAAVAQGLVGIVIALEVTRLSRNSPDWHHLLYLCRFSDTLIADEHTIYDPELSTDRLVLGIRGQMGELELESSIERMVSARWSKAERGELYTIPPAGYDIDEFGQWTKSSDAAVVHALNTVFEKFVELGSACQVCHWWNEQGLTYPVRRLTSRVHPLEWVKPTYAMVRRTLRNPIYSGAYVFGRTKTVRRLDSEGVQRVHTQQVGHDKWRVLIHDHHGAYISYAHYLSNRERLRANQTMRTDPSKPSAVREGAALVQGLAVCGHCGRRMTLSYGGSNRARVYQYRCCRARSQRGGRDCQVIGGKRIDQAVAEVFVAATAPCASDAAHLANERAGRESEAVRVYWAHQVEKAQYEAQRAERQYQAVEPENRVVTRELERRWETALRELERVRHQAEQINEDPQLLSAEELENVHLLGLELRQVWDAETTTHRDRKRLLRCLIEEVQLRTEQGHYALCIVWKGGATSERKIPRISSGRVNRTPEDTVELVRTLAREFDDAQIARVLAKQGRLSGRGIPFTKAAVTSLRGKNRIPVRPKKVVTDPRHGPFNAEEAALELGVTMSTVHRWLRDGVLAGEQLTAGAPWRIVLTDEVRVRLSGGEAPAGWVGLSEAARRLGTSKSQVAYWVKSGKLAAVRVTVGARRCWKIDVNSATCGAQSGLFEQMSNAQFKET